MKIWALKKSPQKGYKNMKKEKKRAEGKTKYHVDNVFTHSPRVYGDITLLQIGRRYCEAGAVIGEHSHMNFFELTIVTAGRGIITANGRECAVSPGDIFLSFPYENHNLYTAEGEKFEYDFFAFSVSEQYEQQFKEITLNNYSADSRTVRDERISYLVALAISEFPERHPRARELLSSLFSTVAIYILRDFGSDKRATANVSEGEIFCQQLMSYIDTHIYSLESLSELSAEFNYNYSYISDIFRKTTGTTLAKYHRARRLECAKVLLEEGKKSVSDVSEMLGYSSPFAFSAAFKRKFGTSPKNHKVQKEQR